MMNEQPKVPETNPQLIMLDIDPNAQPDTRQLQLNTPEIDQAIERQGKFALDHTLVKSSVTKEELDETLNKQA